jgi:hypothetical protein
MGLIVKKWQAIKKTTKVTWRFRLGFVLFILGLIFPIFIPLVLMIEMSAKWKTAVTGLMAFGIPELLWIAAAAILGKEGFQEIKGKLFLFIRKFAPTDHVSRTRYTIGLFMFTLPLVFGWLEPYTSTILPGYESNRLIYNISGDVVFISSFFVLGGDFWDKLQSLFVHGAKVVSSGSRDENAQEKS